MAKKDEVKAKKEEEKAKKDEEMKEQEEATAAVEQADTSGRIKVRSLLKPKADGGNPVALYEQHKDHPGGEAYVAGENPVEVAETPAVLKAISDGRLVKV